MLHFYRIGDFFAVGAPWWRFIVSRAPAGILLRTSRAFPPSHPTTKMCLRLMLQEQKERDVRSLVDVGCGSGVLALAGMKLGAERAVALDLNPHALDTSRTNAQLNHLEDSIMLVRGSTEALAGEFDLVLANLPMPVLAEKLAELVRLSGTEGLLILSGFQDVDRPLLAEEISRQGIRPRHWLSADLSFYAVPPSGSYTWMAVSAQPSPDIS